MVVGENGGTYYAKPGQMAEFNGDRAYTDYAGRNNALGIDLYANIRHFGNKLAYFSPSELMWFGLEHLPYGFDDFDRLPDLSDGIFFPDFEEGRPGIYFERLPPYTGTLNPGWDPALPEYKPLDMYNAMRDALTFDPAHDGRWRKTTEGTPYTVSAPNPGIILHTISGEEDLARVNALLPFPVALTARPATMLKRVASHSLVDSLTMNELYSAEREDKYIILHGMEGEFIERAEVLLEAGDTDWSLFNNQPENVKCGALAMYEQHNKPGGAALAVLRHGNETIAVTTMRNLSARAEAKTHNLLLNGPIEGYSG
jgi:beta-galactosidase